MSRIGTALVVVAVALSWLFGGYHVYQLSQIAVYAIAILGLDLVTGFTGQISLGQGAFFALGAYTAAIAMTQLSIPYWATPALAGGVCLASGYAFGRAVARLEGLYLALATFALAIATPQVLKLDALDRWTGGSQGIVIAKPSSPIASAVDDDHWLYLVCVAVAVALDVVAWNVIRGRTGRALIALRDHPIAATTIGIDVASYKARAFGVSAMFTGIAGALGAIVAGFVSPDSFTILVSIQILVGGVVGGVSSIGGAVFGAVFIELVPDVANKISDAAPWALYGVLLIVCMMAMPNGAAGLVTSIRQKWSV